MRRVMAKAGSNRCAANSNLATIPIRSFLTADVVEDYQHDLRDRCSRIASGALGGIVLRRVTRKNLSQRNHRRSSRHRFRLAIVELALTCNRALYRSLTTR